MKRRNVRGMLAALALAMVCLFAVACARPESEKFTVSFDSVGGSTVQSQEVEKGGSAAEPDAPTKIGYSFSGWMLDDALFDFGTAVKKDVTLKAKWTANTDTKYSVTVKEDGADKTAEYAEAFGLTESGGKYHRTGTTDTQADIAALAEEKAKTGYHVAEKSVLTGKIAGDGSLSLTVEYEVNRYTIVFLNGGGSGTTAEQEIAYNETATLNANGFTKKYYSFTGWKCGDKTYMNEDSVSALTDTHGERLLFVAQWEQNDLLIAQDPKVVPMNDVTWIGGNDQAVRISAGKTGSGAQHTFTVFDELDKTSGGARLSLVVQTAVMDGDWSFIGDYELWFYALGKGDVIASFASGYVGDNGVTLTNNQQPRLTLTAEATQIVKEAGGLEIRIMLPRHNFASWPSEQIGISAFELYSYAPEVPLVNDLSETDSYSYGYAGAVPDYYAYEETNAEVGTSVLNLRGPRETNDTFFVLQMDMLTKIRSGDTVSLNIYMYNDDDTLFDWNAGTYTDYALEVYAFSQSGEYTAPLFTFGAQQYKIMPWRWSELQIPAEQSLKIAEAGGMAVRIRMPSSLENKNYQLYINTVSVLFGAEETVSISTGDQTYQNDIEAEIAKRFEGYCAAWVRKITAEEGAYLVEAVLSLDGYFDRVLTIRYLKNA